MIAIRESGQPTEAEFESPVTMELCKRYMEKYRFHHPVRRLSNWREISLARRALEMAGSPREILDLPCGAGRFWDMLAERNDRIIHSADYSTDMLQVARRLAQPQTVRRINSFQTSAFAIDMEDKSVDCVFCMRLIHHVPESFHRLVMLREFHRVTRDTLCISLWVDGNHQALRRARRTLRDPLRHGSEGRAVVGRADFEREYQEAGFDLVGYLDFLKGISSWRLYVLRKR